MNQKYISLEGLQAYTNKLKDEGTTKKIFGFNIWDTPAQNIELSNSFSMNGTTLNLNAASLLNLGGVRIGGYVKDRYSDLGMKNDKIVLPILDETPLIYTEDGLKLAFDSTLGTSAGPTLTVLRAPIANDAYINKTTQSFDQIIDDGIYNIGTSTSPGPWPIQDHSDARGRMFVIKSNDGNSANEVITQIFMLNNNVGGEGNVYIRSCQQGTWKPWGKLQTNIEVGAIGLGQNKTFNDLIDNGIYSGVNVIQTDTDSDGYPITGFETFVLITVNGYQAGTGITQLKHSINTNGEMKTQSRKQINDMWSEWGDISGNNDTAEIPVATSSTLGGIKATGSTLGSSVTINDATNFSGRYYPVQVNAEGVAVVNVPWMSIGVGFTDTDTKRGLRVDNNGQGYITMPTLPTASSSTRGGIKTGYTTNNTNRNYAVQLSSENAYVNVPWISPYTPVVSSQNNNTWTGELGANKMIYITASALESVTINSFGVTSDTGEVTNYILRIKTGSNDCTFNYTTPDTPTTSNPTIYWGNSVPTSLSANSVYEFIFTRCLNTDTYLTCAYQKYKN